MANFLCNSSCGELAKPPKSFEILCERPKRKKFGYRYMAFVSDTVVIPNPTDVDAWKAFVASGDICISPCGGVELSANPTVSSDSNNCGEEEVLETVYDLRFFTKSADPDGLTHCAYYEALINLSLIHI